MTQTLLEEITAALEAVTPAEIEQARCSLTPIQAEETLIAPIDDLEAYRLWTLAHNYERLHALAVHSARFDSKTHQERIEVSALAERFHELEDILRQMAWRRIADVAGYPRLEHDRALGLRENFTLVSTPDPQDIPQQLLGMGAVRVPKELLVGLMESLRRRRNQEPEEPPKPPKPQ